ncbi:uncharacterized protein UDID_01152 [Ustilago sp. UG-2017a]|nr:uncharacterized protein UDID_01152 [Ustilago sp. UG-2017a]
MVFVDVCIQYLSYQATGLTYTDTHPTWSSTPRLSESSCLDPAFSMPYERSPKAIFDIRTGVIKVLVFGASGSIGGMILRYCLQRNEITTAIALARRPLLLKTTAATKLHTIHVPDFGDLDTIAAEVLDAAAADLVVKGSAATVLTNADLVAQSRQALSKEVESEPA